MAVLIELTQLSPTMQEGTLIKWIVSIGDSVGPGDILAEVETDKAVMEMEAYDEGTVLALLVKEGDTLPMGSPMAIIGAADEDIAGIRAEAETKLKELRDQILNESGLATTSAASNTTTTTIPAEVAPPVERPSGDLSFHATGRILASPLARTSAEKHGIDLRNVKGSGPGGRIVKADIDARLSGSAGFSLITNGALIEEKTAISGMRSIIASRLSQSKSNIPHYYLKMEIEVSALLDMRSEINSDFSREVGSHSVKISVNDLIVRAAALSLARHPDVNSSWRNDHILRHGRVDVGIAAAIEGGLITPYIRNTDRISLQEISIQARELVQKARDRKLKPEEYSDGTFTISNLGMFGLTEFSAIINEPEAAILAVGGIRDEAIVRRGHVRAGKLMTATLSCDHRVIDGAEGARFLNTLKNFLEHPHLLLI